MKQVLQHDFQIILLTICAVGLSMIFAREPGILQQLWLFVKRRGDRLKDVSRPIEYPSYVNLTLLLIFVTELSLLLQRSIFHDQKFLVIALFSIAAICLKRISIEFVGFILGNKDEVVYYVWNLFSIYKLLAYLLLPITAFLYFSPEWMPNSAVCILSILVAAFCFGRLFYSYLLQSRISGFQKIYFFIYFCTLEILPNWLLVDWLSFEWIFAK